MGREQFSRGGLGRNDAQLVVPRVLDHWYAQIQNCIFECLAEYASQISSCADMPLVSPTFKWQWTPVGGGFSVWHTEQNSGNTSNRSLAWMIYLNDVDNGGETEFLYQHMKVKPEAGKVVIWPAGITHPHRGNPPYSGDKFVLTGWFELCPNNLYHEAVVALKASRDQ